MNLNINIRDKKNESKKRVSHKKIINKVVQWSIIGLLNIRVIKPRSKAPINVYSKRPVTLFITLLKIPYTTVCCVCPNLK
jgi:hypothetical protein